MEGCMDRMRAKDVAVAIRLLQRQRLDAIEMIERGYGEKISEIIKLCDHKWRWCYEDNYWKCDGCGSVALQNEGSSR
jgi:hypothetical protein